MLPPRDITVSQWADENVVLSGAGAAERGQWHTRPYQREPMDVLSPSHPSKQVVLMSAAQMLKTSVLLNFLGYIADVDPGPVLVVEPRTEDAKALSKDRVAPLFRATPCLRGKIAAAKSRDSNNTALHKVFTNGAGHITFTGAISPSGLAMRPIRYLLLDEVDRYPASAGPEGDPVSLAIRRTGEFEHNKKILMCSTPTVDGSSRIQLAWNESDQREYFVPCPLCGHFQVLLLGDGSDGGLVWPEGDPEKAAYRCEECAKLIPHHQKAWMVERGEYRAQNPGSPIPGFRVSQLISPKRAWGTIAAEFIAANQSPETLKAFVNTVLAELWEERGEAPAWEAIYGRREFYEVGIVPRGGLLLTMAVDQQRNPARLEWEIKAWGRNRECWSVAAGTIAGDPAELKPWEELDRLVRRNWPHEAGGALPVQACAVDTGWNPQRAYEFCMRFSQPAYGPTGVAVYSALTVVPVKGGHDWQKAIEGWSSVESARKRGGLQILTLGTSYLKLQVYNALRLAKYSDGIYPAGYWHYPNYKEWWFQGLCSEYIVEGTTGRKWKWDKRTRNEPLDLGAYNLAMAELCAIGYFQDSDWAELERRVQSGQEPQVHYFQPYGGRRVIGRFAL